MTMRVTYIKTTSDQYYLLITLAILYAVSCLTSAVIATRLIQLGPFLLPGGVFIFPFSYAIVDIVAELYGYHLANRLIFTLSLGSIIYALYVFFILHTPYPSTWQLNNSYQQVLSGSLRLVFWGIFANYLGSIFNAYILVRLKLFLKGKSFPLRSILASTSGELLLTLIVYTGVMFNAPAYMIIHLAVSGYFIKMLISILLAFPLQLVIAYVKRKGILSDVYFSSTNIPNSLC